MQFFFHLFELPGKLRRANTVSVSNARSSGCSRS